MPIFNSSEPESPVDAPLDRPRLERLRERTHELELLISGLSMVGLFQLLGYLDENILSLLGILSFESFGFLWIIAGSYFSLSVLAYSFALHLLLRGTWVAVLGLKSLHPDGIRWERVGTRGFTGPLTRERLQTQLPTLDEVFARVDRLATSVFAGAIWLGLLLLWFGILFTLAMLPVLLMPDTGGGSVDTLSTYQKLFGRFIGLFISLLISVIFLAPLGLWFCDSVLARWVAPLRRWRWFAGLVRVLAAVTHAIFPRTLFSLPRLTLFSNLRLWPALLIAMLLVAAVGRPLLLDDSLDRFGAFLYLHPRALDDGHREMYFESQFVRSRWSGSPLIPSPSIESNWLPIFLPYWPLRDQPLLQENCDRESKRSVATFLEANADPGSNAAEAAKLAETARACLVKLWVVNLNGRPIPLDDFMTAERRDLSARGLLGYVDLRGEKAGLQRLEVIWNPQSEEVKPVKPEDDLGGVASTDSDDSPRSADNGRPPIRYLIPFIYEKKE